MNVPVEAWLWILVILAPLGFSLHAWTQHQLQYPENQMIYLLSVLGLFIYLFIVFIALSSNLINPPPGIFWEVIFFSHQKLFFGEFFYFW